MPLLAAVAAISDALAAPGGTSSSTLLAAPDDLADRKVAQTCKCTISAEKLGRPPTLDHAIGGTRKPTRYLFIMGSPFTGTTAFHALLAQGMNVSALDGLRGQRQALLSPEKEGWAKLGWKHREDVWSASDSALNWTALSETYHFARPRGKRTVRHDSGQHTRIALHIAAARGQRTGAVV